MSVDIKRLTAHLSPQQQAAVKKAYRARAESSTAAFISCFFLGVFGAHRFYLKQWRQGFLHLLLAVAIVLVLVGGFLLNQPVATAIIGGILLLLALLWEIVDLVRIDDEVAGHNIKLAELLIAQTLLSDHAVEQQADAKLESLLHETAAEANAAANYGRMPMTDHTDALSGTLSPNDTAAAAAPIPAVGAVAVQYDATTVTQISDDPNATQHGDRQSPEAEQQAVPHTESSVETDTVSDLPAEAALSGAALAPLVSEVVTHTHDVSGYSVTDGVETVTSASIPEPPQPDSAAPTAIDPQLLPTSEEANAATWPNYSPVQPEESASSARWIAPDVTDRGEIDGEVKPVADIDPAGVLPLHVALDDSMGAHGATDTATGAGLGAAVLATAAPLFTAESTPPPASEAPAGPSTVAVEPDSAGASPADEGLLFLVPDEAPAAPQQRETPADAYIPPLVPVVSTPETDVVPAQSTATPESAPQAATFETAGAVPAAYEAALAPAPIAYESPQPVEPQAIPEPQPQPQQHAHSVGETLAEFASFASLASLAGLASSAADEAVSLARAHRESLSAAEATPAADIAPAASQTPAAPAYAEPSYAAPPTEQSTAPQPETLAELATLPAPAEEATPEPAPVAAASEPEPEAASAATASAAEAAPEPAAPAEPPVTPEPQPEAVPVAATAAGLAAATDADLLTHHKLKRVRVVRQLKVDGKVVEETSAEEYVDPDADPEPVKARLREQLRQQAQARANTQSETNG